MEPGENRALSAEIVTFPPTLRKEEQWLRTIVNNMTQGVALFDSEARLLFCNDRYVEMYGLSPDIAKPGCTLRDLLDHHKRLGSFTDDIGSYVEARCKDINQGNNCNFTVSLQDGRVFSVSSNPIAGGGWLATHEDITERRHSEERIAHMARHDALTDLPNRAFLRERLDHELKRAKRNECLAVLCLDLDHFKGVNDTLGHAVGDELLKLVSDRLQGCIREIDTIGRLGGDEFAIIMSQLQEPTNAAVLAKRIRDSIIRPYQINGHQIVIDISIGISIAPIDAMDTESLLKNADMALYGAKDDGRGTFRLFEPKMNTRMTSRRELEVDIRKGLTNNEFELYYQPLVTVNSEQVNTFEALIRWNHPTHGVVSPGDFIPIAEETGLIIPLGEWVLRTACKEAKKWPDHVKVAVNLSPAQLKNKDLLNRVKMALKEAGIKPQKLQLEITETVLLKNTFAILATLEELHRMGVQIALDDFGTGYSSLSYLRSFPFDKIKIDQSFVRDLSNGAEPLAIINAIAGLARCLNMISTAEGVETKAQLEALQAIGCNEMQGFLISKPKPASEIGQYFTEPP